MYHDFLAALNQSPASDLEISWNLNVTLERLKELKEGFTPSEREFILIQKMIQKADRKLSN